MYFPPISITLEVMESRNVRGQALVEYLVLFSFMALIGMNLSRGLGSAFSSTVGNIGYSLTQQLTVGVCRRYCFFDAYGNKTQ